MRIEKVANSAIPGLFSLDKQKPYLFDDAGLSYYSLPQFTAEIQNEETKPELPLESVQITKAKTHLF
jgi:hypothetical protein